MSEDVSERRVWSEKDGSYLSLRLLNVGSRHGSDGDEERAVDLLSGVLEDLCWVVKGPLDDLGIGELCERLSRARTGRSSDGEDPVALVRGDEGINNSAACTWSDERVRDRAPTAAAIDHEWTYPACPWLLLTAVRRDGQTVIHFEYQARRRNAPATSTVSEMDMLRYEGLRVVELVRLRVELLNWVWVSEEKSRPTAVWLLLISSRRTALLSSKLDGMMMERPQTGPTCRPCETPSSPRRPADDRRPSPKTSSLHIQYGSALVRASQQAGT